MVEEDAEEEEDVEEGTYCQSGLRFKRRNLIFLDSLGNIDVAGEQLVVEDEEDPGRTQVEVAGQSMNTPFY